MYEEKPDGRCSFHLVLSCHVVKWSLCIFSITLFIKFNFDDGVNFCSCVCFSLVDRGKGFRVVDQISLKSKNSLFVFMLDTDSINIDY